MKTEEIIEQLESLKENSESFMGKDSENDIWKADVEALTEAIRIIRAIGEKKMPSINLEDISQNPDEIDDPLEPLKVASALNSEILKFNYRKEHRPQDISILDSTIMSALMRQMPTKPDYKHYEEKGEKPYIKVCCPNGCRIQLHPATEKRFACEHEYCPKCGQRIFWQMPEPNEMEDEKNEKS